MQLIVFSKALHEMDIGDLIDFARETGFDGYDLAVRPGHPVNPDNVATALPAAAAACRRAGLDIPLVTGNFDVLLPTAANATTLLQAMSEAEIPYLKLGYFRFDPETQDYWREVTRVREAFAGWAKLAARYGVRVCYHTHSNRMMGLNAAALAHLLQGFDPAHLGAYLDPAHLTVEGEEFAVAAAMLREHLALVALKDCLIERVERYDHGTRRTVWVTAGAGMVDWTAVFAELVRIGFAGPCSIHCEFAGHEDDLLPTVRREVAFFTELRARATADHA